MKRRKALWINGTIPETFRDIKGVLAEATRQAQKILNRKSVHIVDLRPAPALKGFYVLVEAEDDGKERN